MFVGDNWLSLKFNPLSWMEARYVQTWCVLNGCRNTLFPWHCVCLAALARYVKKSPGGGSCAGIQMRDGERWRKRLFIWKIAHISKNNYCISSGVSVVFFFDHFLLMGDLIIILEEVLEICWTEIKQKFNTSLPKETGWF